MKILTTAGGGYEVPNTPGFRKVVAGTCSRNFLLLLVREKGIGDFILLSQARLVERNTSSGGRVRGRLEIKRDASGAVAYRA